MIHRTTNPNNDRWSKYGGNGILVCDEWNDYISFRDWAINNGYQDDLTLDRIESSLGYYPENCRWTTARVQMNNRDRTIYLTYKNETLPLSYWCDKLGVKYNTLYGRIYRGWNAEKALTTPVLARSTKN